MNDDLQPVWKIETLGWIKNGGAGRYLEGEIKRTEEIIADTRVVSGGHLFIRQAPHWIMLYLIGERGGEIASVGIKRDQLWILKKQLDQFFGG